MKSLAILAVVIFALPAFPKFLAHKEIGKKPQLSKMKEEPGRLDRYYIAGVDNEESISIVKSENPNITCKNYQVFDEWEKAIGFKSLPNNSEHIFGYAAASGCYENENYVQLKVDAGLWAMDEEGNEILAKAVAEANQNTFGGMPIQWGTPVHMLSQMGIILRTSNGFRTKASFFVENELGFEKRDAYREGVKLEKLIKSLGKREALEKFFDGRVKDSKALSKILDMSKEAISIWFVVNEVPEYLMYGGKSDYHGWSFDEKSAYAYYACDASGCQKK